MNDPLQIQTKSSSKWKYRFVILILLVLVGYGVYQYFELGSLQNMVDTYKKQIIEKSELIEITKGRYSKIVDDFNTQKQLTQKLKDSNRNLYDQIKKDKSKIIQLTKTIQSFKPKVDTVIVESKCGSFIDYYPSNKDWFIQYRSTVLSDTTRSGEWKFDQLKIDLVVTEQSKGIYNAYLDGPDFLQINQLEVQSLPLQNIKPDNFDWLLGGGVTSNMIDKSFAMRIQGGIRIKNTMILLSGDTQTNVGASIIKQF